MNSEKLHRYPPGDSGQHSTDLGESHCSLEIGVEKKEVGCEGSVESHVEEKYAVRLAYLLLVRARNVYRGSCEVRAEDQDERVANGLGGDLYKPKLGVDALELVELAQAACACGRADQQQVNKRREPGRGPQQQKQWRQALTRSSVDDLDMLRYVGHIDAQCQQGAYQKPKYGRVPINSTGLHHK
ncbi:hypothetical protein KL948_004030 [Ogataea haglerorum]|nr:hypothetical protein KL948_004030 [Ogataea haglerorum]